MGPQGQKGDTAVIDFEGFDNGVAFEGGKGENHELEIGSALRSHFEDQIIGMKAGEEKDIDITFPENYTKDLAGKQVVFHVKGQEVKCKSMTPRSTTIFAKDVPSLRRSRSSRTTQGQDHGRAWQSAKIAFENARSRRLPGHQCDIPEVMIEEQCRRFLDEFQVGVCRQGIYDQYCKMTNMNERSSWRTAKEPAMRQVRMDLAVNAIIKEENLDATDEEVEKQYTDLAEKYSMDVNELKKYSIP